MPIQETISQIYAGMQRSTQELRNKINYEKLKLEKHRLDHWAEMQRLQHELSLNKYDLLQRAERTVKIVVEMEGTTSEMLTTSVFMEDGRKLTVKMNLADAKNTNLEHTEIFWDIPCMNGGNTAPRNLKQVQDCKCLVCKTACATILKWRMLR